MDTTSQWFKYLTETRQLNAEVIREAQLGEQSQRLQIPIFDTAGNIIFSKLRRPEHSDTGPKYLYEKGASASLYGHTFTDLGGPIYWTEGELEVLAARTMGMMACSGTGGAMTFRENWLEHFPDRSHVILFDNDETGLKGAVKLAMLLEHGSYSWVPERYGKDLGDILSALGPVKAKKILTNPVQNVAFDVRGRTLADKRKQKQQLKHQASSIEMSMGKRFLLELAFALHMETRPKKKKEHQPNFDNAIESAKAYPVENLLTFRQRKVKCLWHDEKTPSLHLYPDNSLFCHGSCDRRYDAIDVYQKLHPGTKFMEAVEALNKA